MSINLGLPAWDLLPAGDDEARDDVLLQLEDLYEERTREAHHAKLRDRLNEALGKNRTPARSGRRGLRVRKR